MISYVAPQTLYEQDFNLWLTETVELLKARQLERLDYENLIEELVSMGISQKHALESNLIQVLIHLLKWRYQPEKQTNSWRYSIAEHRLRIERALKKSPSLKRYFMDVLEDCYQDARFLASEETGLPSGVFPETLPFTAEQILERRFLPDLEDV